MGVFDFTMEPEGRIRITDHYRIRLLVPMAPTYALPRAYEEQGRIRREADWHMYPTGEMCLGSPLRVLQILGPQPSLMRFVTQCVAPFLYAASWRELGHEGYPFLDLAHGAAGLVDDYERLFGLEGRDQIVAALRCTRDRESTGPNFHARCWRGVPRWKVLGASPLVRKTVSRDPRKT